MPLINAPPHPSYPSGHALESHLIALALAEVAPEAAPSLTALARRIGENGKWRASTGGATRRPAA